MTLAVAARCDGGVLLATDSALGDSDATDSRMFVPAMKGWDTPHLSVLFAGHLWAADLVRRELPSSSKTGEQFAKVVMNIAHNYRDKDDANQPDFPAEFIVVELGKGYPISFVTGLGGVFTGYEWLAIGSGSLEGNVGLDLALTPLRNRSRTNVKKAVGRVMARVGKWNTSVGGETWYDYVGGM